MSILVQVLAGVMGLVLAVIGVLEITQHRNPRMYPIFVIERDDYDAVRMWAINVGFYNLVFAAGILLGLILYNTGSPGAGQALVLYLSGAHVLLGLVLLATERRLWRSAVGQAALPAALLLAFVLT
jgi:putative membrane protein